MDLREVAAALDSNQTRLANPYTTDLLIHFGLGRPAHAAFRRLEDASVATARGPRHIP